MCEHPNTQNYSIVWTNLVDVCKTTLNIFTNLASPSNISPKIEWHLIQELHHKKIGLYLE
jgi:hypothetical protein